jgi:bifunctional non-homologous end joining protein LigD
MPLVKIPQPFDHPGWLYEIKYDGFRALAIIDGHRCRLVSRRGHVFAKWICSARRSLTAGRGHG